MTSEFKTPLVSVIIPARNEFPNVVFTIQDIINDLETFLSPAEWEIIICANCCDDWFGQDKGRRANSGTVDYLMPRGIYWNKVIRVLYDPIAGNHSTRNKGAKLARGKYLFFSDAHMSYRRGYFQQMIKTIDETDGIVHGTIAWLGAYPPSESLGFQYTMKLGDEIKGTWNNYKLVDEPFYIPLQGHCCLGVKRDQFLKFGGYPEFHRCYGGGEFYFDTKWWMFGSTVVVDPKAIGYHLCSARGYNYFHNDYVHNVLAIGWALGMEGWVERAYISWSKHANLDEMKKLWEEVQKETIKDREFIAKNRIKTFNELLIERPWDKLNDAKYGRHNGSILIFQDTWLPLIKGTPAEAMYDDPQYKQKELEEFINTHLDQYVYKRNRQPVGK